MRARGLWTAGLLAGCLGLVGGGCTSSSNLQSGPFPAGIRDPLLLTYLPPLPDLPARLPSPPAQPEPLSKPPEEDPHDTRSADQSHPGDGAAEIEALPPPPQAESAATQPAAAEGESAALELADVLESVERAFPLLLAAEQERAVAWGRRISAEGGFDLNLRSRGIHQDGTFPSDRLDLLAEQPTPWHGSSFFGGYRFGFGDFPVYYGDRLTADGGEFRAGLVLPLLRDGPIDRRRALLRQAQLGEPLADAVVQRLRIDYFRAAAHRYWSWVAAGAQYSIADQLLRIARDRQAGLEEQFQQGQIAEFVVIDNRRLIAERQGILIAAERRLQQAAFDLSLYLRDDASNPVVPASERLPLAFSRQEIAPPDVAQLPGDVQTALALRPELRRFRALKEQTAVELRLAENQALPALNAAVGAAQDVGQGKKSAGIFQLDRTVAETSLLLEVPLQRRDARGRAEAARAALTQLLGQEQFARDQIVVDVQDAVSNLDRTHARLLQARDEQRIAQTVAELELDRFRKGQGTLLEVNLRELAAAGAQSKVVDALADFFRAQADYRAALGWHGEASTP